MNKNTICYVCGFDLRDEENPEESHLPYQFDSIKPFYMCTCCGFHYKIDDYDPGALMEYREQWIEEGLIFNTKLYEQSLEWSLNIAINQLKQLKEVQLSDIKVIESDFKGYVDRFLNSQKNWTPNIDFSYVKECWHKAR